LLAYVAAADRAASRPNLTEQTASMTTPTTPTTSTTRPTASPSSRSQTFLDWAQINMRWISLGVVVVAVAAAGYWFYLKQQQNREVNASRALLQAKQSQGAGNAALAQTDFQNVISRWGNTSAGVEAAMLLAGDLYDAGKYQDGVNVLEKEAKVDAARPSLPSIYSMIGDGYSQLKKMPEAAKAYSQAADAATSQKAERAYQLAKAARAYDSAGNTAEAKRIWTELANGDVPAVAAEARVRVGELESSPTPRS